MVSFGLLIRTIRNCATNSKWMQLAVSRLEPQNSTTLRTAIVIWSGGGGRGRERESGSLGVGGGGEACFKMG